jgi:hypothetical protein
VLVNLTTSDGPTRLVEEATRTFGGLDVLVNNVGAVCPQFNGFLVADLVLLSANGRAGTVTGTDVLIDGGLVKTL